MTTTKHRIRWFVFAGGYGYPLEKLRRTAKMRGGGWVGYDAECSCGWTTGTGGAIENYIRKEVWFHKNFEA